MMIDDNIKKILYLTIPVISTIGILYLNPNGCISYLWTLFLFLLINFFTDKNLRFSNFIVFHLFLFAALVVYYINLCQFPIQQGLTGGDGTITDDTAYYAASTNVVFQGVISGSASENTPHVLLMRFLYPFKIIDPINLIILNILLGLSFLPYLTKKIADRLFKNKKISKTSYWLITFCPFCWFCGLIIMRDVPSLILILWAFLCFLERKYVIMVIPVLLLLWIKFAFIVFLVVPIICYIYFQTGAHLSKKKIWFIIGSFSFLLILYIVILPNLSVITEGRMNDGELFRVNFLDFLANSNEESFLIKIYQQPIYIRIPLLIAAFISMPMLTFPTEITHARGFLSFAYTIYIMFLCGYAFRMVFTKFKLESNAKMLLWTIAFQAMALGMVSLQIRHKVILMPFIYMAIAYGMHKLPISRKSQIVQIGYIVANFIYAIMKLF